MLHVTPSQLNPILKKPPPPPLEKQFLGKKEKKKFNPLSKNCFGKGKKLNTQPFFSLFLNFHLITLSHPHFILLDPTQLLKRKSYT
jgi:hypothetical protein